MTIAEMNGAAPHNIEKIIEEKGLKKGNVAKRVGMSAQDFSGILAGRRLLKLSELVAFAEVLGVEPNDIIREND